MDELKAQEVVDKYSDSDCLISLLGELSLQLSKESNMC